MKCIALNCKNIRVDGAFIGELCSPCWRKLTSGRGNDGTSILFRQSKESYFEDVGAFHLKMKLPVAESFAKTFDSKIIKDGEHYPRGIDEATIDEIDYRVKFMFEELTEFITGRAEDDIEKQADALADLIYVALGTAHYLGVPFDRVWDEVQRANMEKRRWQEGDRLKPRNVANQVEVVKPPGWVGPNIHDALYPEEI